MLNVPTPVRVFLYAASTDMRKSFSGLHGLIVEALKQDPLSGDWFVFVNRRRDRIKIMLWERDGFVIFYKQLQSGTFAASYARRRFAHAHGTATDVDFGGRRPLPDATAEALPARRLMPAGALVATRRD